MYKQLIRHAIANNAPTLLESRLRGELLSPEVVPCVLYYLAKYLYADGLNLAGRLAVEIGADRHVRDMIFGTYCLARNGIVPAIFLPATLRGLVRNNRLDQLHALIEYAMHPRASEILYWATHYDNRPIRMLVRDALLASDTSENDIQIWPICTKRRNTIGAQIWSNLKHSSLHDESRKTRKHVPKYTTASH
jgi:hypothetical protein